MKNDTHDNDNFNPWSSIGWQAALILNRLRNARVLLELAKEQQEDRKRDTGRDRTEEQKAEDHRNAVEQRLRDLAVFERRASGVKKIRSGS